ncbi:leucyl aminopeptidase [Microbacterium sp. STN6]|uniref:leucyl aminopeptidase n=1 Tax=Microbacterium sp. STN6 TaxID=2995588 RepID=UPI002260FD4F|nr:leucyl aminopeptidase [Microbacterium sp. STN6]MCX7522427.1 leucyl aminopeptidase [Microbacterium sp. STN6]
MKPAQLNLGTEPADADVVLVAASVTAGEFTVWAGDENGDLARQLASIGFGGRRDELVRLPGAEGAAGVAVIGISSTPSTDDIRYASGSAVRQLAGVRHVAIRFALDDDAAILAALEGAALGSYAYEGLRSRPRPAELRPVQEVTVLAANGAASALVARASATAQAVALVKDLVNTPPSHLYPETLAQAATEEADGLPVTVEVWDEKRLEEDGFGGILGVGRGSVRPPRLVKVSYEPAGAARHLALVGKGITFDTGGISLKPPVPMVGMKYDMTGAATVLAVALACARLDLPVRVTAWLCIAENMPSGSAMRPNDVLRIHGGRTVEVLNTDAEGRLVLADGLAAASEEKPDAIVDVATLTGAAMVALGTRYAAVMGEDALVERVLAAAKASGELLWPMPLPDELRASLNTDAADIANATPGNTAGGMLLAGVFLREFVGTRSDDEDSPRIPWAHLDIAGPAKTPSAPFGFTGKGPTGVTVRALLALAEEFALR